jgi:hypothetical protein
MDILSQIIKWASTTQYMTKSGTDECKAYIRGYEQGIADAKAKILAIANSENQ